MSRKIEFAVPVFGLTVFIISLLSGCKGKDGASNDAASVEPVFKKVASSQSGISFKKYGR
jgi:hypothetical protein